MIQNMRIYLLQKKILIGLSLVLLGFIVVPFWTTNSLGIYDAPGHVSLVWYLKGYLWPGISGWNPFFLSGFPQGLFYPSLFHWVSATLAFLVGVDTAVKLVVSAAIVLLPFSVLYAVKNTISEEKYWFPFTFFTVFFLALLPGFLGVGFRGLFQIGLIPNFVSIIFFFVFIGLLFSEFKKGKVVWLALVFSVLILTHLVTAIAAGLLLVTYLKVSWFGFHKEIKFKPLIIFGLSTTLLTAFFWIPFILNFSQTSTSIHVASYFSLNLVLGLVGIVIISFAYRNRSKESLVLSALALFLISIAIMDSWLISSNSQSLLADFLYSLHVYRFQPYAYLTLILSFGGVLTKISWQLDERFLRGSTTVLFLIILVYLFSRSPVVMDANLTLVDTQVEGRFIESFRRTESDPLLYTAQTKLVMQNPQENQWAYGLFTDSTPNGPYLGSLIRSFRPEAYPEGEGKFIETKVIDRRNIHHALDIFGINYTLNLGETGIGKRIGTWEVEGEKQTYFLEKVNSSEIAEVFSLPPEAIAEGFDKKMDGWWNQDKEWISLPVEANELDIERFDPRTKVEIVSHNEDWTNIKLNIVSDTPQPVLVKFSYFPWWKATMNGENVPIYRAAPNQMLVIAKGEVDLEFRKPYWINWLYVVSAMMLVGLIYSLIKRKL